MNVTVSFADFTVNEPEESSDAFAWWLFARRVDYEVDRMESEWHDLWNDFRAANSLTEKGV